jgi:hypothetical protein
MKKEIALHFLVAFVIFAFISIVRNYLSLNYWPFWIGAIIGTILPDIDHIIYVYYLNPQDLTSQRVNYMVTKRELWSSWELLANTRSQRTQLILHTALFQVIFMVLTFLVISSSGNLLGRAIVIAFSLHLLTDEVMDLMQTGGISNWLRNLPIALDSLQIKIYLIANAVLLGVMSLLL